MPDRTDELTKLQIELIEAFKTPTPIYLDDSSSTELPRVDEPKPEVTEEQTVSIPGEEDLPIRTPTPELFGKCFRFYLFAVSQQELNTESSHQNL